MTTYTITSQHGTHCLMLGIRAIPPATPNPTDAEKNAHATAIQDADCTPTSHPPEP